MCASGSLFAAPSITNLNPNSGASGTSVVISGSGFGSSQGTSKVTFGGVTASVTTWSSGGNSITATVPSGLVAGSVNVVVNVGGTNSNSVAFTVTNPLVSNLSINSAPVGQAITINGSNLGSTQGSSSVTFNGTSAIPSFWNTTSIVVPVPTGATTGNIVVTVNGNASPGYAFMVTPAPQAPGVHFIQGNYSASQEVPSSVTVPFPIEQNAGDLNVVVIGWRGAYNVSVADTSNNTYALAVGPTSFSSWTQAIYYAKNISGAADNSVTVTFTQKTKTVTTEIAIDVRIAEYSGLDTNSPFDVAVSGSGTSNTADSGFVSTTNQNDVLVGSGMADGVIQGAGSNYALRVIPINANVNNSDILEDRIVTATGSYDATAQLSGSKSFLMQMVAFKEAQNQAPVVNAGPNQTITLPTTTATLNGTATDDGLPNNAYNLSTNTTTITNPDGGTVTRQDDSFGNPLSLTEQVTSGTSRTTTYQYDSKENLIKVVRPCGNATCSDSSGNDTWVYTYDGNGFQTSIQAPGLPADSKTYNQFGGITSQTDAANTNTVTTQYDSNFNPIQVTDKLNGTGGSPVATYSNFDAFGNFHDSTDANGTATHLDYYQTGPSTGYLQDMIIFNLNNVQEKTSYTYDAMGKVLTVTDACGNGSCPDVTVAQGTSHTTTNTYDQLERLSTATDASGSVTKYLYDNNGNKTDEYDAYGTSIVRHTHWDYDNLNRAIKITYNDGTTKQFLYDWRGNKTQETDQLGHITKYFYDLAGQLASVTSAYGTADSGTVSDTYDLDGRQQTITDENNQSTGLHATNTYDAAGRLINVQDALGNSTSYGYDADGRRTSLTEPNNQQGGLSTTYAYDPRNRLKTTTYPPTATQPATTMQYTYDGMGRVLTSQDQNGNITTKTYDNVGRLTSVKDAITPNGNLTSYQYDLNGNLTLLTDANQHKTQYQYDTMNRRLGRTLPLGQSEAYSYDPLGRLQSKLDFNGKTTQYNYDSMDRLLSKVPDSSLSEPTINFTYTSGGQLCSASGQRCTMTDASGTTNYGPYDNRDRLLVKATPEGTLTYTYDAHGNVTGIKSSNTNGAWMTYQNDALNRLSQVCDKLIDANCAGAGITTYAYDATGNLAGYVYPNTVQTQNIFDPLDRLTQTCSATGSPACSAGTKLSSYSYGLAPAGNRLAVTELNGRQVLYSYDNDYRLNSEAISGDPAGNNSTTQYIYDPFGNRQQLIVNGVTANTYTYDANDRLTTDGYDANGNTTASAGTSNTYDFENRMLTHGSLTLTYDGDGNRVWETVGGTTTKYLVDDHNPSGLPQVLDELVNGSVTRTYAYGPQRITETQLIGGNWTASLYGYDGHGNVRFLTNSAGAITDSYDFDTFGMPIRASGTTPNQFLYSGERYDSSAGLYDLRARYYNQATGRFWAMDRWEGTGLFPITLNKYIYTGNDPVDGVDPLGFGDAVEYPTITFQVEHFALRHLIGAGLNPAQVQAAVTTAINTIAAAGGVASIQGWFWGTVQSGGLTLVYRAFPIALGKIIVGTIYPGP